MVVIVDLLLDNDFFLKVFCLFMGCAPPLFLRLLNAAPRSAMPIASLSSNENSLLCSKTVASAALVHMVQAKDIP